MGKKTKEVDFLLYRKRDREAGKRDFEHGAVPTTIMNHCFNCQLSLLLSFALKSSRGGKKIKASSV